MNSDRNIPDKRLWNRRTAELEPYVPGEQPKYRCVKLNTNENPYPPPESVAAALRSFDPAVLRKYPDPSSDTLRRAVADRFGLTPGMVFPGNGSDEILAFAFRAFFDEERPAAFADITYSFYPVYAKAFGIPHTIIPLNDDFTVPADRLARFGGGVVLANPNAPTGICTDTAALRMILEAAPGRLVLIDEAYIDFGGETAVPLLREFDNLLIVRTFSKSLALAGLRVGYALGAPSLIAALETVRDTFNSYTVDRIAQTLAAAALEDDEWFARTRQAIAATRESMTARLAECGFRTLPSAANFIFTTHPDFPAPALYEGLKEKGIIVRYFNKPRIGNYLRITVGTPQDADILCDALARLTRPRKEASPV